MKKPSFLLILLIGLSLLPYFIKSWMVEAASLRQTGASL